MPDAAVFATQRQFIRLLEEGAQALRRDAGLDDAGLGRALARRRGARWPSFIATPAHSSLRSPDAIIVTGAEPRAAELDEEPYWRELTQLVRRGARTRLRDARLVPGRACAGAASRRRAPAALRRANGRGSIAAEIVSAASADRGRGRRTDAAFALERPRRGRTRRQRLCRADARPAKRASTCSRKDEDHLVLFFQGHPEYDGDTLAREFRRDVARALRRRASSASAGQLLRRRDASAVCARMSQRMVAGVEAPHLPAVRDDRVRSRLGAQRGAKVVGNWLTAISARKSAASGPTYLRARWGG